MSQDYFFEDVPDVDNGALGGDAAKEFERVTTTVDPKTRKVHTVCTCGSCGRKNAVDFEWEEIIIGSQALVPPNWIVNPKTGLLQPNIGCALGNCHVNLMLVYTPTELQGYVRKGVDQGFVDPNWAAQFAQQMRARAGR